MEREQLTNKPPPENPPDKFRLVQEGKNVHIYKGGAVYSILYGYHTTPEDPADLPEILNGLFLEQPQVYGKIEKFMKNAFREHPQDKYLFPRLEKDHIPIYFPDLAFAANKAVFISESTLAILEIWVGILLMSNFLEGVRIPPNTLLELIRECSKALLAVYLTAPLLSTISKEVSYYHNVAHSLSSKLIKFTNKINPALFFAIGTLRNIVIAHKEEWLAREVGDKPHFVTVLGRMHVGIEDQFQASPEERIAFLRKTRPLWRRLVVPENFYKIIRFDFNGNEWRVGKIFEVPELKELVTS